MHIKIDSTLFNFYPLKMAQITCRLTSDTHVSRICFGDRALYGKWMLAATTELNLPQLLSWAHHLVSLLIG